MLTAFVQKHDHAKCPAAAFRQDQLSCLPTKISLEQEARAGSERAGRLREQAKPSALLAVRKARLYKDVNHISAASLPRLSYILMLERTSIPLVVVLIGGLVLALLGRDWRPHAAGRKGTGEAPALGMLLSPSGSTSRSVRR